MNILSRLILLPLMAALFSVSTVEAAPQTSDDVKGLTDILRATECFSANARFVVTMPQLSDDVVYELALSSSANGGDRLLPCDYLIDWKLVRDEGSTDGFFSYFDGHHYRFSGEKLQEYHMEWDSVPFMPQQFGFTRGMSVQRGAQFVDLLPQIMADEIDRMTADSLTNTVFHPDTLVGGARSKVVDIIVTVGGEVSRECEYVFDFLTSLPVRVTLENSPGSIGEQTVMVSYEDVTTEDCSPLTEDTLIALYPQVFEQFRQSNFRIENMRGARMPGFALPTLTGERYSRRTSDSFQTPMVIVLLEGRGGFNDRVIADVRSAVESLPLEAGIIWIFTDNNIDVVESQVGESRRGEHVLMSGRGLVRDCGAADLPVVILVDKTGVVRNIHLGYNQSLSTDVIQEMSVMAQ